VQPVRACRHRIASHQTTSINAPIVVFFYLVPVKQLIINTYINRDNTNSEKHKTASHRYQIKHGLRELEVGRTTAVIGGVFVERVDDLPIERKKERGG
jgi:hypothetical protein